MNNFKEKISVIIPVFNVEKYLEESVRSVINQSYRNLEIICVNDGSTDNSLSILEELANEDQRIIVINQENKGQGEARNTGLQHATAEWISFLDSDDTFKENAFQFLSSALTPDVDLIHFGTKVIYNNDILLNRKKTDNKYHKVNYKGLVKISDKFILNTDVYVWNKIFRKSIIDKYNIKFESIRYEDFQFTKQYIGVSKSAFCFKEKLHFYNRREGSIMYETFNKSPYAIDHLYAYNYILEFYEKHDLIEKYKQSIVIFFHKYYYSSLHNGTEETLPLIVEYATNLYGKHQLLQKEIVKIENNNQIDFIPKNVVIKKNLSKILEYIISLKGEDIGNNRYKVLRICKVPVYKKKK